MKILVTGADGFVGSHLTQNLIHLGYDVKAFVQYNSFNNWGWLEALSKEEQETLDIFSGDIRDPYGVREAIRGCDVVIHLAALIAIPYSYHSPEAYIETNIKGTLNILQASRDLGIEKVIHTSTSEVYGTAKFVPITEEHPILGQSPYSATKIAADHLAYSFYASFGLPITTIRPFNTYGPRQSARAVIPTVVTQLLQGKKEIKLGSLSPTRDFNYVKDTVNGFIAALNAKNIAGDVINIGSNFEVSIGDTVGIIADLMSVDVNIISDEKRIRPTKSEVERLWADNQKARKILNWTPKYAGESGFRKGLLETIEWFSDPNNLRFYKSNIYNL